MKKEVVATLELTREEIEDALRGHFGLPADTVFSFASRVIRGNLADDEETELTKAKATYKVK